MSLREQARKDFRVNLNNDGDPVIITYEDGTIQSDVVSKIAKVDMKTDPVTGIAFDAPHVAVTCSLIDLEQELTDKAKISGTDSEGKTFLSFCRVRRYDRTIGFVSIEVEELES